MTKNKKLIDPDTGEIYDMGNYYLRAKSSDKAYKRKYSYMQDNRHFSFANMENLKLVTSNISTVHCGYLLILQCYMEFGTGKLKIARKEMPKAVGTSERSFNRFMTAVLIKEIVLKKGGEFYINSQYHFRTKTSNERVIKLFTTKIKLLKNKVNISDLGFLYKLLPYVHYDTNMICDNPFAKSEEIRFLNQKEIAKLVDMDEKKTSKRLEKLREVSIVAVTKRKNDMRDHLFTLNPYIFYRKKGNPDERLRNLFTSKPYET